MGKVAEPLTAGKVTFGLERLEFADGERFEVGGRWFGIRGRRFIRPSLTLVAAGCETRLLADLAHKPWAAEDGEMWEAAFPSTDGWSDAEEAELNVAPDLTIRIPVPGARKPARAGRGSDARRSVARERPQPAPRRPRERPDHERVLRSARAEIATLRERIEQLTAELERAHGASEGKLRAAEERMGKAVAARGEALAARDEAIAALGKTAAARDAVIRERDASIRERGALIAERDDALRVCDAALRQRDEAVAGEAAAREGLERALAERDTALAAQEIAAAERDRLRVEHERRGATMVMRNAAIDDSTSGRREARGLALAIGAVCLLIVFLIAALLFGLH